MTGPVSPKNLRTAHAILTRALRETDLLAEASHRRPSGPPGGADDLQKGGAPLPAAGAGDACTADEAAGRPQERPEAAWAAVPRHGGLARPGSPEPQHYSLCADDEDALASSGDAGDSIEGLYAFDAPIAAGRPRDSGDAALQAAFGNFERTLERFQKLGLGAVDLGRAPAAEGAGGWGPGGAHGGDAGGGYGAPEEGRRGCGSERPTRRPGADAAAACPGPARTWTCSSAVEALDRGLPTHCATGTRGVRGGRGSEGGSWENGRPSLPASAIAGAGEAAAGAGAGPGAALTRRLLVGPGGDLTPSRNAFVGSPGGKGKPFRLAASASAREIARPLFQGPGAAELPGAVGSPGAAAGHAPGLAASRGASVSSTNSAAPSTARGTNVVDVIRQRVTCGEHSLASTARAAVQGELCRGPTLLHEVRGGSVGSSRRDPLHDGRRGSSAVAEAAAPRPMAPRSASCAELLPEPSPQPVGRPRGLGSVDLQPRQQRWDSGLGGLSLEQRSGTTGIQDHLCSASEEAAEGRARASLRCKVTAEQLARAVPRQLRQGPAEARAPADVRPAEAAPEQRPAGSAQEALPRACGRASLECCEDEAGAAAEDRPPGGGAEGLASSPEEVPGASARSLEAGQAASVQAEQAGGLSDHGRSSLGVQGAVPRATAPPPGADGRPDAVAQRCSSGSEPELTKAGVEGELVSSAKVTDLPDACAGTPATRAGRLAPPAAGETLEAAGLPDARPPEELAARLERQSSGSEGSTLGSEGTEAEGSLPSGKRRAPRPGAAGDGGALPADEAPLRERVARLEELLKTKASGAAVSPRTRRAPPSQGQSAGLQDRIAMLERLLNPNVRFPPGAEGEKQGQEKAAGPEQPQAPPEAGPGEAPEAAAEKGQGKAKGEGKGKGKGKGKPPPPPAAVPKEAPPAGKGKGKAAPPPKAKASGPAAKAGAKAAGKPLGPAPRKPEVRPRIPMKRLFWNSFVLDEAALDGSTVWGAIEVDGMDGFDAEELEELFGEHQARTSSCSVTATGIRGKGGQPRIRVFEEARRRQVCVMLARLPPVEATVEAVAEMDDVKLNKDQVELLLANAPAAEELAALRSAAAEHEHDVEAPRWDDAEAFVLRLSEVPSFALRLQVWAFENSFDERFEIFHSAAMEVRSACAALRRSPRVKTLLALALSVGNYLNAGTSRGRADGFAVEALAQMRTVKALQVGAGTTLVDYVVRQCERSRPGELEELFTEGREAAAVRRAARHKLPDLLLELTGYQAQAEGLVKRALAAEEDSLGIRGQRVESRLGELAALRKLYVEAEEEYKQLCSWFHEGSSRAPRPSDEFFGVWDGFLQAVRVGLEGIYGGRTQRRKSSMARPHRPMEQVKRSLNLGDGEPQDAQAPRGDGNASAG